MVWDRLAEYSVSDNDIAPIFLALDANFRFIEFRTTWYGLNGRLGYCKNFLRSITSSFSDVAGLSQDIVCEILIGRNQL